MRAARSVLLLGCGAVGGAWVRARWPRTGTGAPASAPPATAAQMRLDRLRHDLRGALAPALLCADRLVGSDDPAIRHAGEVIVRAIDRATAVMETTRAPSAAGPKDAA